MPNSRFQRSINKHEWARNLFNERYEVFDTDIVLVASDGCYNQQSNACQTERLCRLDLAE